MNIKHIENYFLQYNNKKMSASVEQDRQVEHSFSVGVIGYPFVGKSTYITRLHTAKYVSEYTPTVNPKTTHLKFFMKGSDGVVKPLTIIANEFSYDGSKIPKQDGYLLMFDLMQRHTYDKLDDIYNCYELDSSDKIILCGNKCDNIETDIKDSEINFHREKNIIYYPLSVRSNYNYEKPIQTLTRKMFNDDNIVLSE